MNATNRRLQKKIRIRGAIETLTGLHIGGSDVGLKIGGADKVVVKDPKTGRPFIPGSTLKGKIRCLLEKAGFCCEGQGIVDRNHHKPGGKPQWASCFCGHCIVCQMFGVAAEEGSRSSDRGGGEDGAPAGSKADPPRCVGRLIVRDARLSEQSAQEMEKWRYLSAPYIEVKTEVSIDRLTSAANPRYFERVPPGAVFEFEMILDVMAGDDQERYLRTLFRGFQLLSNDYLGGQGTRGYGAVRIRVQTAEELDVTSVGLDFQQARLPEDIRLPWQEPRSQATEDGREATAVHP